LLLLLLGEVLLLGLRGEVLLLGLIGEERLRGEILIPSGLFRGDLITPFWNISPFFLSI